MTRLTLAKYDDEPDLDAIRAAIQAEDLAESTRYQYARAVVNAVKAGVRLTDGQSLKRYAQGIPASERGFLRAGLKCLVEAERDVLGSQATPNGRAATVVEREARMKQRERQLDAAANSIRPNLNCDSERDHVWLSKDEVRELLESCHKDILAGLRDYVALGLVVGAGLRRIEVTRLRWADIKQTSVNGRTRTFLDIHGKGDRDRNVPIADGLARALERWREAIDETEGFVVRAFTKGGNLKDSISGDGLWYITKKHGKAIGRPELSCHDLRRTWGRAGYEAGVDIESIRLSLGHSSIRTTQAYIGLSAPDMENAISDHLPYPGFMPV